MTNEQVAAAAAVILSGHAANPSTQRVSEAAIKQSVLWARQILNEVENTEPIVTYLVTMTAGPGGTIAPLGGFTANKDDVIVVNITPEAGMVPSVAGTTPGTLVGNVFTTDPVTAHGTVDVTFAAEAPVADEESSGSRSHKKK